MAVSSPFSLSHFLEKSRVWYLRGAAEGDEGSREEECKEEEEV
jgi:hypothetical protein